MIEKAIPFVVGVLFAPLVRPVLRQVIKVGIIVSDQLQRAAVEAREELQDITAEATAEVRPSSPAPKSK